MGKDLRVSRPNHTYERFLVYPSDTNKKEILDHTAIVSGAFRGTGGANAVFTKDEFGNIVKSFTKNDEIITNDKIDLKVGDYVYNTYAKELYIVLDWVENELPSNLEFSTRPVVEKTIRVKSGLNG